ncbi:MAG: nucleotidyltransferase [Clostridiales bacterium]|nr:nucleotidyltransferase [Clostridiales bacterium]
MKTVGIIAEYNPFHNGHEYHIAQAKEMTGADYCVVVMSGNFTQRGIPAIIDKSLRIRSALMCGADLIIELPVHYATGSAEYFASGAVALLDKLGIIDSLCFGSECGDIDALSSISDVLISENEEFKDRLKQNMKAGQAYPHALASALESRSEAQFESPINLLQAPNNILGIEYIKALSKQNSHIKPYTLTRKSSDYNDDALCGPLSSALAIREAITKASDLGSVKEQLPTGVYELIKESYLKTFPVLMEDFFPMLLYKLIQEEGNGYSRYFDVDEAFSDRLKSLIYSCTDYASLCEGLKTRNITATRTARNLLHILLSLYQSDMNTFCAEGYVYYARIVGFKKEASALLSAIKECSSIPLISKLADADLYIDSDNGKKMLAQDIQANHIYSSALCAKFHTTLLNEYTRQIIII